MSGSSLSLYALPDIPLIHAGDDLPTLIIAALARAEKKLEHNDIFVIAQKIISKAEGRIVNLADVVASEKARHYAAICKKDPRLLELILSESKSVLRCKVGVIIVEHHSGLILANAGIDHSNVGDAGDQQQVTLLPRNTDASARAIRKALQAQSGKTIGVIINDSIGRAWRLGTVGTAIGSSGLIALRNLRGAKDLFGKTLAVSETADIDALASAAGLLMGEADKAAPVILIRGFKSEESRHTARTLVRLPDEDMFR